MLEISEATEKLYSYSDLEIEEKNWKTTDK